MSREHDVLGIITPRDLANAGMAADYGRVRTTHPAQRTRPSHPTHDEARLEPMPPPTLCVRCGTAPANKAPVGTTCPHCGSSMTDTTWERLPPERLSDRVGATVVFLGMLAGSGVGVLKLLRLIFDGPFTVGSAVVLSLALAALGYMIFLSVYVLTDIFFGARWSFRTADGTWSGTVYSVLGWAWDGSGWSTDHRTITVAGIAPRAVDLTSTYAMRAGPRALFEALPCWQQSVQREGGMLWRPADQAAMVLFAATLGLAARNEVQIIHGETRGWTLKARRASPVSSPSWRLPQIRLRALGSLPHDAPWLEQQIVRVINELTAPRVVDSLPSGAAGPYRSNSARDAVIDVGTMVRAVAASKTDEDPASALLARLETDGMHAEIAALSTATESFLALCASHPALITALRSDIFDGLDAAD